MDMLMTVDVMGGLWYAIGAIFSKTSMCREDTAEHHRCLKNWIQVFKGIYSVLATLHGRVLLAKDLKRYLESRLCSEPAWDHCATNLSYPGPVN